MSSGAKTPLPIYSIYQLELVSWIYSAICWIELVWRLKFKSLWEFVLYFGPYGMNVMILFLIDKELISFHRLSVWLPTRSIHGHISWRCQRYAMITGCGCLERLYGIRLVCQWLDNRITCWRKLASCCLFLDCWFMYQTYLILELYSFYKALWNKLVICIDQCSVRGFPFRKKNPINQFYPCCIFPGI